jgi:hypothetical protein
MSAVTDLRGQIIDDIAATYADPLAFVNYAFPWRQTGPLADEDGPDKWQTHTLKLIAREVQKRNDPDAVQTAIQMATASGHGCGKGAVTSWIVLWFMSTRPNCQIVVTANTASQLSTKTWREVAKWHKLAINADWFRWTATKLYAVAAPNTWFASAIPWSENNPEAFAGTHESSVLIVFDEASRISDTIWDTASGAMTTAGAMWLVFGNPTRNSGAFRECFGKWRHRWITQQIDSRDAKSTNKAQLQQWVDDYGEDSDYVRVRIRGEFPRIGDVQLIGLDAVERAMERDIKPEVFAHFPKMIGVDVARFGNDSSIIIRRQGPMAWKPMAFNRIDTMALAGYVIDEAREFGTQTVFVDGVGVGGGVVDRLRSVGLDVIDVQSGEAAGEHKRFKNRRMELWMRMKEWLDGDVSLPAGCNQLRDDLIGPEYGFDVAQKMQLESTKSMKDRGLASPDYASALAMTFADFSIHGRKRAAQTVRQVRWA